MKAKQKEHPRDPAHNPSNRSIAYDNTSPPEGLCFTAYSLLQPSPAGVFSVDFQPGYSFQSLTNARAITYTPSGTSLEFCVDTGSSLSLISRHTLAKSFPTIQILQMTGGQSVRISGIGEGPTTNQYVKLPILLISPTFEQLEISGEVHVVDSLSCQLLIGVNILRPNGVSIELGNPNVGSLDSPVSQGIRFPLLTTNRESSKIGGRTAVCLAEASEIAARMGRNLPVRYNHYLISAKATCLTHSLKSILPYRSMVEPSEEYLREIVTISPTPI